MTSATAVIAAANSPWPIRKRADWVCTGTNDDLAIAAHLALYKTATLAEGQYSIGSPLTVPAGRKLTGTGYGTVLAGATSLTGSVVAITADHCEVTNLTIAGGNSSAGVHGVSANCTSSAGYTTGSEACVKLSGLEIQQVTGHGIYMAGANNRDSSLHDIKAWNCGLSGFYFDTNCPDGSASQLVTGSSGSDGFVILGANWHLIGAKSWYAKGDGYRIGGVRHSLANIEAQDCQKAGIRITGQFMSLGGAWMADSNSYSGTANRGLFSGLELGRNADGTTSWASDLSISAGQAWDKNEGGRGRNQAYGVRVGPGVRGLALLGVGTGAPGGTHCNLLGGISWDNPADATDPSNLVHSINARVAS
jgi:hypothetical protein